ncbi:MAG TPA: AMP-binding protein [Solirubrobacteraceae bacterium]
MVWRSTSEPLDTGAATLHGSILATAEAMGDRVALVDGPSGVAVTYAALAARIERTAAGLAARGLGPGDVLALWAPNAPEWAIAALGALAAGATVSGASPVATERELAAQAMDCAASLLATVPARLPAAREVAATAGVREVVALGEIEADGPAPAVALDPARAVGLLPYSSGTTGLPKGVMLTHANLVAAVGQVRATLKLTPRDTILAIAPFAHVMGFVVTLSNALSAGATVVTMPSFTFGAFVELIDRHRATVLVGPPPMMAGLAGHPAVDSRDLSSLELIVSGGAPVPAETARAVGERLPGAVVRLGYGLTETTATATAPDRELAVAPGSVGRAMPGTELRVVDPESGVELGAGEPGELWVRGPQTMAGYLHRPDATAAMIDADGWLRTGDLVVVDDEGHVFIVDRLKELIKVNAFQVAPAELEAVLAAHPAVADAAVIGRPDAVTGEAPVAAVVARDALDPADLMAWVAARVAPYKRIRAVRFVDAIPRTPAGKILRRVLVEDERQRV